MEINNEVIERIIKSQKDFHLLPRNRRGRCIYNGILYINDSGITELPNNLTVTVGINCDDNNLTELPRGLKTKELYCRGNRLVKLPCDMVATKIIKCDENFLTELPDNLNPKLRLNCSNNNITKLPSDLVSLEHLNCSNNKLTELPDSLKHLDSLICSHNKITKLPSKLRLKDYLDCSHNLLSNIPEGLTIKKRLIPSYTKVIFDTEKIIMTICDLSHNCITEEIKAKIDGKCYIDKEQLKIYYRTIKLRKIIRKIQKNGQKNISIENIRSERNN